MTWTVRRLAAADAGTYREIRLEALRDAPEAFGESFETACEQPVSAFEERIGRSALFAAIAEDDSFAGTAGFLAGSGEKMRHRGTLFGVYVRPAHRGTGCAAALIEAILAYADGRVSQVHLAVATDNAAALRTYATAGFESYGTDPRALRVADRYIDEVMMVRFLEAPEESER